MIKEENIAAALVAKMAGMELKKVDDSTLTQSSSGPATRIDPKSFLLQGQQNNQQQIAQRHLDDTHRLAEQLHPLPQTFTGQNPFVQPQIKNDPDPNQLTFDFLNETATKNTLKQLDLIVDYLYSINNKLDKLVNSKLKRE